MISINLLLASFSQAAETSKTPRIVLGIYLPGVNDETNLTDIRIAMDYWLKEISRDLNFADSRTDFFLDIKEMSKHFNNNQLDIIIAPPLPIAKYFKMSELTHGLVGVRNNGDLNSLILLTRNDSGIKSLADLRGKRLLIPKNDELSEVFIDSQTRKLMHQGYREFFGNVNLETKNSRMILDLFFGKADAALVYLHAYDITRELNPQIEKSTRILLEYPLRSKNYTFFSKNFEYTEDILKNLPSVVEKTRGKQLLELFKTEKLENADLDELLKVKALYDEYLELKTR